VTANSPRAAKAGDLLENLPSLHHWGGRWRVGGLTMPIGERIVSELSTHDAPRVLETGAGASTLLFCCLEPSELTSIAPDSGLRDRIFAQAAKREIPVEALDFICERSEVALPPLAAEGRRVDVALIDGCHNWPGVFVDFCYINMMMGKGGTLFVDDVHLYSVGQLYALLRQQEGFEYVGLDSKLATFRKLSDDPFLPEWRSQPYIEHNSVVPPASRGRP
jgi:hypothetical protein